MGWQDRDWSDRDQGSRFSRFVNRIFRNGESPLEWAVPFYTLWGIRVRIHLVFIVYAMAQLAFSIPRDRIGFPFVLAAMLSLFVLVLLHEYGHCFACRRVGGSADRIIMWPLGGLAFCIPPDHWKAHFITTIAGPAVNAVLWPVLGLILLAMGVGWHGLIFNPFDPGSALGDVTRADGSAPMWLVSLWWAYYINLMLLGFNFLPMYPMDGGRLLQALLWARGDYQSALRTTARVGLGLAIMIGVWAMVANIGQLVGIAIFAGLISWQELTKSTFVQEPGYGLSADESSWKSGAQNDESAGERPLSAREKKKEERVLKQQQEIDRILAKISRVGMDGLTAGEKRMLKQETRKQHKA